MKTRVSWPLSSETRRLFSQQCWRLFPLLFLFLFASALTAQIGFTRIQGPADQDVASPPPPSGILGHVDAAALSEVVDHLKAVGTTWQDMSATGTITYPGGTPGGTTEVDPATLTILNGNSYRLDVQRPSGTESLRIDGEAGAILDGGQSLRYLPRATAAHGLVDFPLLRVAGFPGSRTSLFDQGSSSFAGAVLHRISVETPLRPLSAAAALSAAGASAANLMPDLVTDFYFDPASHLLVKSAELIQPPGAREQFLQCTTYEDYRTVDGILVPFSYTRTLDGQVMWVLQLSQVTLNSGVQQSTFSFTGAQ